MGATAHRAEEFVQERQDDVAAVAREMSSTLTDPELQATEVCSPHKPHLGLPHMLGSIMLAPCAMIAFSLPCC